MSKIFDNGCLTAVFLAGVLAGLLASPGFLAAQSQNARLLGTVTDQTGAIIPGATVTAISTATKAERSTTTNDRGDYIVESLMPGIYVLRVQLPGFQTQEQKGVRLEVGQHARVDFSMAPGQISETVTVVGRSPVVDSETADIGQVTGERMIKDLPLNGRDTFQLSRYTTGAVVQRLINNPNADPPMDSFNGQSNKSNMVLLDGGELADMNQRGIPGVRPIPDTIQEFKVVTNNYSVEYGQVSGAVINLVTRSGTNAFHGTVWDFMRNEALDANNFFANRSGIGKLPFKRQQFGGTFGGPLLKNRTFFFVSYEGLRDRTAQARSTVAPTEKERQGIFGVDGIFVGRNIYDPFNVVDGRRLQFPNNTIPQSRFNPVAKAILGSIFTPPLPNQAQGSNPNFFWADKQMRDQHRINVRLDHRFSDGSQVWGRWTWQEAPFTSDINVPGARRIIDNQRGQHWAAGWVRSLGPRLSNDLTVYLSRKEILEAPEDGTNYSQTFGFDHAKFLPKEAAGVVRTTMSPYFEIRQSASEGTYGTTGGFHETLTWQRGNHYLKLGFSHLRYKSITAVPGNAGGGTIAFDGYATAQISGGQGNPFADFLLGTPQSISLQTAFDLFKHAPTKTYYNWFIGDDWKVTPNLTVTLGIRQEISLPVVYADNNAVAFFDLGADRNKPVARLPQGANVEAMLGGPLAGPNLSPIPARILDTRRLTDPDYLDFAPRVGIAWRPFGHNRTSIRTGYGISYDDTTMGFFSFSIVPQLTGSISGTQTRFAAPALTLGVTPPVVPGAPRAEWPQTYYVDPRWVPGYVQNWSLSFQQEIARETKVEVAYVGNKGTHLFGSGTGSFNVALPAGKQFQLPNSGTVYTATGTQTQRRPYPAILPNPYVQSDTNSSYNALQTRLERRFADGLSLVAGYTWSKTLLTNSSRSRQNQYDRTGARSLAPFHAASAFFLTSIYELPWARTFTGVARQLLHGWEFTSLVTLQSGQPEMEIDVSADVLDIGRRRTVLPNRLCDGNLPESQRTVDRYFNTACFAINPTDYGNSVAYPIFSDGIVNVDLGVMKRFPFGESRAVEFRTEFFNAFNNTNFGPPNGAVGTTSLGRISNAAMARQIQFALKIQF